ncbi:hypothetical protein KL918_001064 [Ogataea parapolymorpha]|uniref:Histidinol-phosphatase n=1 Tax=Ogataea parapolymorpha (strain ATCC 26012 / BCRC 20466 / JCM 22074 / NRRL Y-7560 / DL-1) TaxID=871575 RepID=W1Q9G4_OGAPD|nr:histidinol-phosphatase (PHP family) [Ogataea parapolymorpha DL-1]ESW97451.1 histidinol-phosphatase (PHP family) [Ogataea parapolymorpha DL-1]KAG7869519.1 hypothetical protein KL918_001064 [Ogataea parapolymorpha]KAG7875428.1 hypothetical protein KL916_000099 [Ogataea parapolymorpha]
MVHSHHSHSGQYVSHAVDNLDDIISRVKDMNFEVFCLTEHVPRYDNKLMYPEEIDKGYTVDSLVENFEKYYMHARSIQKAVNADRSSRLKILVGFETEGGIDEFHLNKCLQFKRELRPDVIVGSVHHLKGVDLDFNREKWLEAKGNLSLQAFFLAYFKQHQVMVRTLEPDIIGHFDLIRLFALPHDRCEDTGKELKDINIERDWPEVWKVITETVELIVSQGGLVELNTAAIRKGWTTSYPKDDLFQLIREKGGRFCLSDDSHGVKQVGLNYEKALKHLQELGLDKLYYLDLDESGTPFVNSRTLEDIAADPFWNNYT